MRVTLEKIVASAQTRLKLPAGAHPSQEIERYRKFLALETHRLKMRHRDGGGGLEVCHARALVLDLLLGGIVESLEAFATPAGAAAAPPQYALVATGGYGRGELNPCSDLDVLFLHTGGSAFKKHPPAGLELFTKALIFDMQLKVGHFVRSIDECVSIANADMQSKTSLIEARFIWGNRALFEKMRTTIVSKCVKRHETEYMEARLADQASRRAKYGNTFCLQEPNVKNGCGGLRDYQNLLWMAFFKYSTRTLADLESVGLIAASEREQLDRAYDFLLRTRTELHYHTNRSVEILTKSVQPSIAHGLGYSDRSLSRRIEKFMGDYYGHARNIHLITSTLEQRLALLPQPKRLPTLKQFLSQRRVNAGYVLDGFKFVDGYLHPASERIFKEQPNRMMRAFRYAQQRNLKLHPDLAQLIRNQLDLVDAGFRKDAHVHETFLEILNQRGNVAPALRAMHEVGFLGRYITAFGKMTCLVQHEFFHQYTADEHTLVCIEKLDSVWGATKPPYAAYNEVFQRVDRPFILYLALLLHDAGKVGHGRNHAETGSRIAFSAARRLGLDPGARASLTLLIRNHLEMTMLSQRRDLDDPGVIRKFADLVLTEVNLDLLTLHSFADSMGTSDQLWNGFKDTLLWSLYHKTRELLIGGTEFIRAEARQRDQLAGDVRSQLVEGITEDELQAHFKTLPARYFRLRAPKEIASDMDLAHRFMLRQLADNEDALHPVVSWHHEADRGYSLVRICTWDRPGLFSRIAGSLTAAGLNILGAEIFTREDSIVLDSFFVTDAQSGVLANTAEAEKFEQWLRESMAGEVDFSDLIRRRRNSRLALDVGRTDRAGVTVRFDNQSSEDWTVIDIETEDRLGLLYTISQALAQEHLNIYLAKIYTERGAAMDSFFVSELNGSKIVAPERQRAIHQRLSAAIHRLG